MGGFILPMSLHSNFVLWFSFCCFHSQSCSAFVGAKMALVIPALSAPQYPMSQKEIISANITTRVFTGLLRSWAIHEFTTIAEECDTLTALVGVRRPSGTFGAEVNPIQPTWIQSRKKVVSKKRKGILELQKGEWGLSKLKH